MEFTVILAVHNEERLLPKVLPSIRALDPAELIVCYDRCTDKSMEILREFCFKTELGFYECFIGSNQGWKNPKNHAYASCLASVDTPVTLRTTCDVLLDPSIKQYLARFKDNLRQKLSFRVGTAPVTWRFALKLLRLKYGPQRTLHDAVYALGTEYFRAINFRPEDLSDSIIHDRVLQTGGAVSYIPMQNIYLRPNGWEDSGARLAQLGQLRGRIGFPLWKTAVNSFLYLKPHVLREHLREKLRRS